MPAPTGNTYALGNDGGRPALFNNPEEMAAKMTEYFECCRESKEPLTVTGLALFIGFDSRQSLYDYQEKEEYSYLIRKARTIVENGYELKLHESNCTGAIFALKNMNWRDKTETDITTGGNPLNQSHNLQGATDEELERLEAIHTDIRRRKEGESKA